MNQTSSGGVELSKEDEHLAAMLKKARARLLPSGRAVTKQAIEELCFPNGVPVPNIKERFSELVNDVQIRAYEIYLNSESPAVTQAMAEVFRPMLPADATADDMLALLGKHSRALDKLFLGLSQGRKSRAGSAFEYVVSELFSHLNYPYTPQPEIDGTKPDFVLPSHDYYKQLPIDCIIFTLKRIIRERWRQILTEGTHGLGFFLGTIDPDISPPQLAQLAKNRIRIVVPAQVKAAAYSSAPNVLSFEEFFRDHLDPAMTRWRANGIVPPEDSSNLFAD